MASEVLVTGSTGALGRALVRILGAGGRTVRALDRSNPEDAPRVAKRVLSDLRAARFDDAVDGCDVVFHLAAYVHAHPRSPVEKAELHAVNHDATLRLADAARRAGAVFVFASSVAVYGPGCFGSLDEGTPLTPVTDYGNSKLAAEVALRAIGADKLDFRVVRLPLLYGPRGRGNLERMLRAVAHRRYWPVGDQSSKKSVLHFEDAARALVAASVSHAMRGRALVASSRPYTMSEIHEACWSSLGRGRPPPALPAHAARLGALLVDGLAAAVGRRSRLEAQIRTLTSPAWYDGSAFSAATGFAPTVDIAEGIASTAAWLRARGDIQ